MLCAVCEGVYKGEEEEEEDEKDEKKEEGVVSENMLVLQ